MTISTIWADGAENYATVAGTDITTIMTSALWDAAAGVTFTTDARTGIGAFCLRDAVDSMRRSLCGDTAYAKVLFSAKFANGLPGGLSNQFALIQVNNVASQPIFQVNVSATGRIRFIDYQGNQLAMSTRELAAGVHNHFELNFSNQGSTMYAHLRVNGDSNFTLSYTGSALVSHTTSDPGSPTAVMEAAEIQFGASSLGSTVVTSQVIYDDIAAFSTASGDENTYLGLYGVYYLPPIADGHYASFLFSTGSTGWNLINEIVPDGDSSYIYANSAPAEASYIVAPLPANVTTVYSFLPIAYSKKTDAGPASIQLGVRHGSTDSLNGSDLPLLTNYSYLEKAFDTPPDGGTWSPTSLPEIIIKRTV